MAIISKIVDGLHCCIFASEARQSKERKQKGVSLRDFFLFLGQFDCSDKIPMDEDDLLFRSGIRHLFRREYIDALRQGADDFCIQFLDLGVLFDLYEEEVDVGRWVFALNTAWVFLLVSLAYHLLMMLRNGVKSLSCRLALSIPLLMAMKRTSAPGSTISV